MSDLVHCNNCGRYGWHSTDDCPEPSNNNQRGEGLKMVDSTFGIGSRVRVAAPYHVKYPGIWTVKSRGPVNSLLVSEEGGRRLRIAHTLLTDPDTAPPAAVVTTFDATFFNPGEFVRITGGKYAGLWMVIRDSGKDKVSLAKPGGDGGRYLRAARHGLVKVDPSEVLK